MHNSNFIYSINRAQRRRGKKIIEQALGDRVALRRGDGHVGADFDDGGAMREGVDQKVDAHERQREFAIALDAANNSALLSRNLYRSGLTDFTTLNQQETALLNARNGLSQAQADQATALVALYAALGGGWDARSIPDGRPAAQSTGAR